MAHGDIEERFRSRRERLQKTCQTRENKEDIFWSLRECILYFWNYNASVCTMGKVGSGNWRSHAQIVNEISGHPMYDGRRRELFRKPWQQIIEYTKSLSRWITVRHPLTRLVSCYQDKFRNGSDFPERKRNVLQEFLWPALLSNDLVFKDQESDIWQAFLDKRKKSVEKLDPEDERARLSVTFKEFLNHVANTFEDGRIDRHWKTYGLLCSPCFFDYEYIARTETQDQDLEYLFSKFGFPSDPYQAAKVKEDIRTKMKRDFRYYESVPLELKLKIYNIYKADMEMFGYDLPDDFWNTQ
ncbi:carbohydrate sulfotransferase 9-like [Penaeus monodon]|uniref:carbohydrate sulfotransferase 9-like n=1 Tax=Penaeus monodon TaxID=6687 RepID=UPI0018A7010D|nr:carbohydrate sulfotransferase 9-like [Penaeus monodon]